MNLFLFCRKDFRNAFSQIKTLRTFWNFDSIRTIAMSGTLTVEQQQRIPELLGMNKPYIISENCDRPNIILRRVMKSTNFDVMKTYEDIYQPLVTALKDNPTEFPVTLLFLSLHLMSSALAYSAKIFGFKPDATICDP